MERGEKREEREEREDTVHSRQNTLVYSASFAVYSELGWATDAKAFAIPNCMQARLLAARVCASMF